MVIVRPQAPSFWESGTTRLQQRRRRALLTVSLTPLLTTNVPYTLVMRYAITNATSTIWVGTDPTAMTEGGLACDRR